MCIGVIPRGVFTGWGAVRRGFQLRDGDVESQVGDQPCGPGSSYSSWTPVCPLSFASLPYGPLLSSSTDLPRSSRVHALEPLSYH